MAKRGWSKPLGGFADQVERDMNKRLRATALQALSGVIERSPVDTGAFRSNNRVSVGTEDSGYSLSEADPSGRGALAAGSAAIRAVRAPFTVIYVQNNLPYAEVLERGNSTQAPQGIYDVTFNNLRNEAGR